MKILRIVLLILGAVAFNVLASAGFKLAANSADWRGVLRWQVPANIAGFVGVLILSVLLRFVPLNVGYAVVQGLTVIGVQVLLARLLFHENIHPMQWLGSGLVVAGIVLICAFIRR